MDKNVQVVFPLDAVLSVTTGIILVEDFGELHRLLDYLTEDTLWSHQLVRAMEYCAPLVFEQHPQLAAVNVSGVDESNWRDFLAAQVAQFGEFVLLSPVAGWQSRDPIEEAVEDWGTDKVKVIYPDGAEDFLEDLRNGAL